MFSKLLYSAIASSAILTIPFSSLAIADGFELIGSIPSSNGLYYWTMAPQGDFIAMGDGQSPGTGIDIISIEDPENMALAGHVNTGHMTYQLAWKGDFVYSPASWDGFFIYDVSNFGNIFLVSDTSFGESISATFVRGDFAILGGMNNLYSIDISNPYHPDVVFSSSDLEFSYYVLGDSIAYVFRWCEDVILLDISSPESPREITRFSHYGVNGIEIHPSERYIYLTCWADGLIIYDISDLESPRLISEKPMPNNAICIDVCYADKYPEIVFISGYTGGLWAVDVSDPERPIPLDHYMPITWSCNVMSYQNILFHTAYNSLLAFEYTPDGTDINDQYPEIPTGFSLSQNYPNPFNAATIIEYSLPSDGYTIMEIYDIAGRKIETLLCGIEIAGHKSITWDGSDYSSGLYFCKLTVGNTELVQKMVLLK